MIFNVPLGAWSLLQIGTAGHLHLLPAPDQTRKPEPSELHVSQSSRKQWRRRLLLPLWESLPGGEQHATCSFVPEANFAAQDLHRVASSSAAHLHLPQVVDVTRAILRKGDSSGWNQSLQDGNSFISAQFTQCTAHRLCPYSRGSGVNSYHASNAHMIYLAIRISLSGKSSFRLLKSFLFFFCFLDRRSTGKMLFGNSLLQYLQRPLEENWCAAIMPDRCGALITHKRVD